MHASEFARKRARIERQPGRRPAFYRRALDHLVREAGAEAIVIRGQLVGWRMPDGGVVCVKQRYRAAESAHTELERIGVHARRNQHVPVRVYECPHCNGFHLTSQARSAR